MISARLAASACLKFIMLPGTNAPLSVSHLSSVSDFQRRRAFLSAGE